MAHRPAGKLPFQRGDEFTASSGEKQLQCSVTAETLSKECLVSYF